MARDNRWECATPAQNAQGAAEACPTVAHVREDADAGVNLPATVCAWTALEPKLYGIC